MFRLLLVLVVSLLFCARPSAAEFSSYAVLQDDASLVIQNKVVRLFGIYIYPRPWAVLRHAAAAGFLRQPRRHGPQLQDPGRAIWNAHRVAMSGFVTCQEMGTYDDGSISAVCWTRRSKTDLGAYLIRQGLALAGPDAPFEYRALERIAQTNGLGVWGFQADQFRFRRFH